MGTEKGKETTIERITGSRLVLVTARARQPGKERDLKATGTCLVWSGIVTRGGDEATRWVWYIHNRLAGRLNMTRQICSSVNHTFAILSHHITAAAVTQAEFYGYTNILAQPSMPVSRRLNKLTVLQNISFHWSETGSEAGLSSILPLLVSILGPAYLSLT